MSSAVSVAGGRFGRISLLRVDRPVAAHAHPHCHALIKVGGVDSFFEVGDRRLPLVDDSIVLVNPWQRHGYPYETARGSSLILALYVEPDWLTQMDHRFGHAAKPDFFRRPCARTATSMRRLALAMSEELMGANPNGERAVTLLEALMAAVIRTYSEFGAAVPASGRIGDHRIRRAMQLLRDHPARTWDIAELADAVALSRAHFFERFQAETGVTPQLFRNALRMETAYDRLYGGEARLADIARDLGFSAQSHFSRFFRDNHGVAPGAYLRAALKFA